MSNNSLFVMIYSVTDELIELEDSGEFVSLTLGALVRIHQRVIVEDSFGRG